MKNEQEPTGKMASTAIQNINTDQPFKTPNWSLGTEDEPAFHPGEKMASTVMQKYIKREAIKTPAGSLETEAKPNVEIISHDVVSLAVTDIQHFTTIPDFGLSAAFLPMVLKTRMGFFCIDGFEKIRTAAEAGDPEIRVESVELSEHSEADLVLRKLANRLDSRGGTPPFPTVLYTITKAYEVLVRSKEGLKPLGHGGDRRSAQWTGNRKEDVKEVLSLRLHKDRDTVNAYLRYGKWLTDETFEALIEGEADRDFFEIIQPEKTSLVKTLEGKRQQKSQITEIISMNVLKWLDEYDDGEGKPNLPLTSARKKAARAVTGNPEEAKVSATVPEDDATDHSAVPNGSEGASPMIGKQLITTGKAFIDSGTRILEGLTGGDLEVELKAVQVEWEEMGHEIEKALILLKEPIAA
jgi:hypothetical protein